MKSVLLLKGDFNRHWAYRRQDVAFPVPCAARYWRAGFLPTSSVGLLYAIDVGFSVLFSRSWNRITAKRHFFQVGVRKNLARGEMIVYCRPTLLRNAAVAQG